MSKFIDKLKHIYRTTAPALGFRKSAEETELPQLALIATLDTSNVKKAKSLATSKIDAVALSSKNLDAAVFKGLSKSFADLPLGLQLGESDDPDKIKELLNLDWDFIIFGLQTPFDLINKEGCGKILRIEPSMTPNLIRAVNDLSFSIDAVLIAGDNVTVTIERLLTCQLFASLINKPLLINVNSTITKDEVSCLHSTGIKGLILAAGTPLKVFSELTKIVSDLPRGPNHKAGGSVLLPRIGIPTTSDHEKIEEDDDEEEEDI